MTAAGQEGDRQRPARVLVKAVNWLGDLVMSLPALRAVRHAYPAAHLAVLVKAELAGFFDGVDWLDEIMPYRVGRSLAGLADRRRVVADIRARTFDLAILLPRSFESAFWTALAGVPRRVGFAADARGLLLTDRVRRPAALFARHQVHDYLYLLRETLGIEGRAEDTALTAAPVHRAAMQAWLQAHRRHSGRLIAVAAAAAYGPAKEWPAARWTALIDQLATQGAEAVLLGAPAERARSEAIAAASRGGALVAAGATGIGEALALLSLCDGFAGNDSGAMHVAAALGIPTVGIFGSTNPTRTGPLGPRARVLYHQIDCSPCLERTCRFGHYDCLQRVAVADVETALGELGALG
ncbi:MAG: lipopolysaccharide heptosyltransferase II [Candidatus Binatia bacterium]